MSELVTGRTPTEAWARALMRIVDAGGHMSNLCVAMPATEGDPSVLAAVDEFLARYRARPDRGPFSTATVANTVFPEALRGPDRGTEARNGFYARYERVLPAVRRHVANRRGTYFERMVRWGEGTPINQLESIISRLQTVRAQGHQRGNMFELSIHNPQIDRQIMGFPCLS